ncbi:MAG: dethiobiotin synthase [Flavobacteriales bacterium CG_4_9_14_3_um_filter_40_17]|nr:MAG: dethiobiotin synthase [Flavobacteriales bacterium CG_4_9_14_3_um_filter_40_17]
MNIFITGIGTDVGKTIVSAIVVEALQADYWKPIQAGNLDWTDTHTVASLVSNKKSVFHPEAFRLKTPMSPHAAAEIEHVDINLKKIKRPKTKNRLVIEGAGGLLVPLNNQNTIVDLIRPDDFVLVVSKHYLGSINHTLMTLEILKSRKLKNIKLIFKGIPDLSAESIIEKMSGITVIGLIDQEKQITPEMVSKYASQLKPILKKLTDSQT